MYYTTICFLISAWIGHACYHIWKIKKQLHMLQLNSYYNQRYFNWLLKRKNQLFQLKELEPLIAFTGLFFYTPLIFLMLLALIYFKLFLALPTRPEKKPLVFTPRATRLFILNIILLFNSYLFLLFIWWTKGNNAFYLTSMLLIFYHFLIPVFLLFTNYLLLPLEKLIQFSYLNQARNYLRTLSELKIVGITGSFGKTTTKYILAKLLSQKFSTLKTPGSYNTPMGITKIIRSQLKPIHEIFIVEMSAKKVGDIKEICKLVKPQYGLITALGEQHLDTFKTFDNIKKTKNELIESLPADGIAFFNLDDPHCQQLVPKAKCKVITYAINFEKADYKVVKLTLNENGSNFQLRRQSDGAGETFRTPLLGNHNIYNVVAAIAIAAELGVKLTEMAYPLRTIKPIPHRLELKQAGKDIIFIDDAYNANPQGSKIALEVLAQITGKRKIIVTPGMVELGNKEYSYNYEFGKQIALACDYVILVGHQQTHAIQAGLKAKQYPHQAILVAQDFIEAKQHLDSILQKGDVVLFENDLPDNFNETIF